MINKEGLWSTLNRIAKDYQVSLRLKLIAEPNVTAWSNWLIEPSSDYVEISEFGPILKRKVEWVELNPISIRRVGRLVPSKSIDYTDEIVKLLEVNFQIEQYDGVLRISLITS